MNIRHYIFAAAITATTASCNDWLDVEPSTETDRSQLFANEDGFADAMAGIYVNMCGNDLYGKSLTWYGVELMGGSAKTMYGTNGNYMQFSFHPDAQNYSSSLRTSFVDPIWNGQYNAIANINSLLESIDNTKAAFAAGDKEIFKGEALGLRAFLHFDLLRLFGPSGTVNAEARCIPYVEGLTSDVYPLLTVKEVAGKILDDLKAAKELLKDDPMVTGAAASKYICSAVTGSASYRTKYNIYDWHNRRFHFNYYAAVATMARVYLWMGDRQNALACAKEIIGVQQDKFPWVNPVLVSNVATTGPYASRDRTFSMEQIFALNITDMEDRIDGYMIERQNAFTSQNGNIMGFYSDVFDEATRAMDPRYAYLRNTFSYYGTEFCLSNKYYKDEDYQNMYSPWSRNRLPLIRVSEMYYIAAECEDNLQQAAEYLETVRRNRGMASYPVSVTGRDGLQQEIEKEYSKEFIAEGQLFYYKKRRNEPIANHSAYETYNIEPTLYVMPRPDDEDTYGGRN